MPSPENRSSEHKTKAIDLAQEGVDLTPRWDTEMIAGVQALRKSHFEYIKQFSLYIEDFIKDPNAAEILNKFESGRLEAEEVCKRLFESISYVLHARLPLTDLKRARVLDVQWVDNDGLAQWQTEDGKKLGEIFNIKLGIDFTLENNMRVDRAEITGYANLVRALADKYFNDVRAGVLEPLFMTTIVKGHDSVRLAWRMYE